MYVLYALCSMPDVIKRSEFMKKYLKNNRRLIHNFKFLSLRSMFYALCSMLYSLLDIVSGQGK
jgi:hypothetical protein